MISRERLQDGSGSGGGGIELDAMRSSAQLSQLGAGHRAVGIEKLRTMRYRLRAVAREQLVRLVPTEHEGLEGKHQCLKSQYQGVHEPKGIHNVKSRASEEASLF